MQPASVLLPLPEGPGNQHPLTRVDIQIDITVRVGCFWARYWKEKFPNEMMGLRSAIGMLPRSVFIKKALQRAKADGKAGF